MPVELDFRLDRKAATRLFSALDRKSISKVLQQSINKTIKNVQAEVSREVRKDRAFTKPKGRTGASTPARFVRDRIRLRKAFRSKSINRTFGEVNISGRGVSLIRFGARPHKKGVTVKVKKDGPRKLIRSAFIARLKHNNTHVVSRISGTKKLKALYSTTVSNAAENRMENILKHARVRHAVNFNAALSNMLRLKSK